jgi:hypothetical protein
MSEMHDILNRLQQLNESAQPVIEGSMKHMMHADAERMSRKEFVDKYGEEHGEFWDNIMGELEDEEVKEGKKIKQSAIAEGVARIEARLTEAFKTLNEKQATSYSPSIASAGGSVKGSYGQSGETPKVAAPATPPKVAAPATPPKVAAKPSTSYSPPIASAGGSVKGSYGQSGETPKVAATPPTPPTLAKSTSSDPFAAYGGTDARSGIKDQSDPFAAYGGTDARSGIKDQSDPFAAYGGTDARSIRPICRLRWNRRPI